MDDVSLFMWLIELHLSIHIVGVDGVEVERMEGERLIDKHIFTGTSDGESEDERKLLYNSTLALCILLVGIKETVE